MIETLQSSTLRISPFSAKIGALVSCGDVRRLDQREFMIVYRAYLDNLVLLIRDQHLSEEELLVFGRRFGELTVADPLGDSTPYRHPEIAVISNVVENGVAIGRLGDGEATWHTDGSYLEKLPTASLLYAIEVPPAGGDTGFSNMYMALKRMPAALRTRIRGRTIRHHKIYTGFGHLRPGHSPNEDPRTSPGPDHPIECEHPETGHAHLFLGRPNAYINGLPLQESQSLLEGLWAHAGRPEFTWHHRWRVGDILIWDNRCVVHRRDAFDPASRRIMLRTMCKGTHVPQAMREGTRAHPRAVPSV